jgi:hypothetical protein
MQKKGKRIKETKNEGIQEGADEIYFSIFSY